MKKSKIKYLSTKTGFTATEIKVIIFLALMFILGAGYKYFKSAEQKDFSKKEKFDYSDQDKLFFNSKYENPDSVKNFSKDKNLVDSKHKVLDFNNSNFKKITKNSPLKEKSINLNSANLEQLVLLPGIGEKTAKKIIEFRQNNGKFSSVNQLLKVKGIGKLKLNKIKIYLTIE